MPFGLPLCARRLRGLGCEPVPFRQGDRLFVTDNGNYIIDCLISPIPDAAQLEREIVAIPGVVGTGLFLGMASAVLVGSADNFDLIEVRVEGSLENAKLAFGEISRNSLTGNDERPAARSPDRATARRRTAACAAR